MGWFQYPPVQWDVEETAPNHNEPNQTGPRQNDLDDGVYALSKRSYAMDKKTTIARENKKVILHPKQKVVKPKTIGVKSRIKGVGVPTVKKPKGPKDRGKSKPAPIPEAGYALYSSGSEASLLRENDTCNRVLNMLKEKRKGSPVTRSVIEEVHVAIKRPAGLSTPPPTGTSRAPVVIPSVTLDDQVPRPDHVINKFTQQGSYTPFNDRLSSSTPDPDRPQIIPERDTNSAKFSQPRGFQPVYFGKFVSGDQQFSQSKTDGTEHYRNQGFVNSGSKVDVIASGSEGFVPTEDAQIWNKRDSDIRSFQAYIPRESTGFMPLQNKTDQIVAQETINIAENFGKNHSGSSSDKDRTRSSQFSQNTANSSGTEYIFLPRSVVDTVTGASSNTMSAVQVQNGLYQIRPLNPSSSVANQMIGAELIRIATPPTDANERQARGSDQTLEVPERDTDGKTTGEVVPRLDISPDSISTITGTETVTPRSILTTTSVSEAGPDRVGIQADGSSHDQHRADNKDQRPSAGSDFNEHKTVSFNTQSSHFSTVTPASDWSGSQNSRADILYHLVDTQAGKQLVPVQVIHHPVTSSHPQQHHDQGSSHGKYSPHSQPANENSSKVQGSHTSKMTSQGQQQPTTDQEMDEAVVSPTNPWSRVRLDAGLKRLRYLVSEIKECGKISKDVEIGRLAKEVEKTLESVPQLSSTFSLQAEVDLAMQPLRAENAQLRRKLRLANQHLKEQGPEKDTASLPQQVDFNVVHLQASNSALQKQVKEEKETKVKLAAEVTELHSQIQRMQIERNKLLTTLSEKETEGIKVKQECLTDAQKFRHEMDALKRETEAISLQQQASDQENHILQISLQQRDAEIGRLQDIVQTVKDNVSELLQDLDNSVDRSLTSNTSLHKLLRILGNDEKPAPSPGKSILSEPRHLSPHKHNTVVKTLRFENDVSRSGRQEQQARLTQENLASHDKFQKAKDDVRFRESNSDSEVELTVEEFKGRENRWYPRQRRRSTSPIGRIESTESHHKRALSSSPRHVNRLSRIGAQDAQTEGSFMKMFRGVFNGSKDINNDTSDSVQISKVPSHTAEPSCKSRVPPVGEHRKYFEQDANMESNRSEASMSRYSVTDYFRKYPVVSQREKFQGENFDQHKHHHRAYSQPAQIQPRNEIEPHLQPTSATQQPAPLFSWSSFHPKANRPGPSSHQPGSASYHSSSVGNWSSHVYHTSSDQPDPLSKQPTPLSNWTSHIHNPATKKVDTSGWRPAQSKPTNSKSSPQDHLFQGTVLDNSISAIDDDNISSVSGSGKTISSSSTTVDESNFRKGIASLDANILKLQLALQKTKSMLS